MLEGLAKAVRVTPVIAGFWSDREKNTKVGARVDTADLQKKSCQVCHRCELVVCLSR